VKNFSKAEEPREWSIMKNVKFRVVKNTGSSCEGMLY